MWNKMYEIWVVMKNHKEGTLYNYNNKKEFDKAVTHWSKNMKTGLYEEVQFINKAHKR
jgi:hypothetical protein